MQWKELQNIQYRLDNLTKIQRVLSYEDENDTDKVNNLYINNDTLIQHIIYNVNLDNKASCNYDRYHGNNYKECKNLLGFFKLDTIIQPMYGMRILSKNNSLIIDASFNELASSFYYNSATRSKKERFAVCLRLVTDHKIKEFYSPHTNYTINNKVHTVDKNIEIVAPYTTNGEYKEDYTAFYTEKVDKDKFMYHGDPPLHRDTGFGLPGEVLISANCRLPGVVFFYNKLPQNNSPYTFRNLRTFYYTTPTK